MPLPKSTSPQQSTQYDALHIPNLHLRSRSLKVVIEFGTSYSSVPKSMQKAHAIDTLLEFYGHSTDVLETQAVLKGLLDKKAQEYWQNSAKLYSVGKSVQMLEIQDNTSESLFVP